MGVVQSSLTMYLLKLALGSEVGIEGTEEFERLN
jgi:hypothetical protein